MKRHRLSTFSTCGVHLAVCLSLLANLLLPAFAFAKPVAPKVERTPPRTSQAGPFIPPPKTSSPTLKPERPAPKGTGTTLLDRVGLLKQKLSPKQVAEWKRELAAKATSASRKFQLRLWLAEARLRVDKEPEFARNEVEALLNELPANSPLEGVATLDLGITLFATGRYRLAERTLTDLLASKCGGYDRNGAALLAKHANACAGYHEERAKAGITEPSHIDPLCGASGLAIALRHLGRTHKKADLAAKTPHTGFGSSLQDLIVGAKNLGLHGYPLSMDGKALRTYFTVNQGIPVIAHVEHDHFIAVTAATAKGVTYWCSDCGPWPGGERTVTWHQWTLMEADAYLGLAVPGSDLDVALAHLGQPTPERVAFIGAIASGPILAAQAGKAHQILSILRGASIGYVLQIISIICGLMPQSDQCPPCEVECPYPVVAASATADPVNLANGAEEYTAPSALHVYNPSGPSVTWTHSYNSLARTVPNGWGQGWHHPYLLSLFLEHHPDPEGPGDTSGFIYFPNSARMPLVFPSSSAPQTVGQSYAGTVQAFMPYLAAWRNDPIHGEVIELTSKGRTKYLFKRRDQKLNNTNAWQWMLTSIVDPNGLRIDLEWTPMTFREWNWLTLKYQGHGLTSIKDSSGSALLTLGYEDSRLVSVSDRYGRSIHYTVANFESGGVNPPAPLDHDELMSASVIGATGTPLPVQFEYDYTQHFTMEGTETVAYLNKIRTKSPTGTGFSEATIYYHESQPWVDHVVDANGNETRIFYEAWNQTRVEHVKNGVVDLRYSFVFNAYMSWTQFLNAEGTGVIKRIMGSSNPYRPTQIDVFPTNGPDTPTSWYFTWDQYSNLITTTSPKQVLLTFTWDYVFPLGRLMEVKRGTQTSTQFTYYEPSGLLHEVKSPIPGEVGTANRQTTTYTYDTLGNVKSIVSPGNNAGPTRTTTLDYGTNPVVGLPESITDPLGKTTSFTYTRGMVETVTDPDLHTSTIHYNLADQPTESIAPATNSTGGGHAKQVNTYLYTGGPLTRTEALDESGGVVRTVDFTYGPENELLSRSGSTEPVDIPTYDAAYHPKATVDGKGGTTTYTYDQNGRVTQVAFPGSTGVDYDKIKLTAYDLLGRVRTRVDGRGQTTTYTYDDRDLNLSSVAYSADPTQNVALSYDDYDRVYQVVDGSGVASATFDDLGLTLSATRTYTGLPAKTATYTYYPDGSRESMVNPAGTWTYLYDIARRPMSMTSPAGTSGISYFDNGWIKDRTLPNGSYSTYGYNPVGMLTSLINKKSDGTVQANFGSATYDGVFNLTGLTSTVASPSNFSGSTTWSYDTKDRLMNETSTRYTGWNHGNDYDGGFNPTTFKNQTRTYNQDNQLTGSGMVYDGNGNPTTYNGAAMAYDVENRVTSVGVGGTLTNGYRSDGLRAWKQDNQGVRTYFLYDGGNPILELDPSGAVKNVNVFAPDGLVARKEGSTWTYYTFDPQGNVLNKLDSNQNVTAGRLLDAWGQGVETTLPRNIDPWGYNAKWGYYYDRETQLYLCQHRMYDASTGRWLNRDPIGLAGGMNLYGYCGSGPVGAVDPTGFSTFGEIGMGLLDIGVGALNGWADSMRVQALGVLALPDQWEKLRQLPGAVYSDAVGNNGPRGLTRFWAPLVLGSCEMVVGRLGRRASSPPTPEGLSFVHPKGMSRRGIRMRGQRIIASDPSGAAKYGQSAVDKAASGKNPTFIGRDGNEYPGHWIHEPDRYVDGGTTVTFGPPWQNRDYYGPGANAGPRLP